ncbi:hypothetical protein FRC11_010729 [Ceratobasidium sp. 423]|nr:hypothetical protein FRC11_010729 [Ceratobasidium sp. 423]
MTSPGGQLAPGSPSKSTAGNTTLNSAASVTLLMEQFNTFLQLIKDANTNAAAAITALTNNSGPSQPAPPLQSTHSAKATSLDSA